MRTLTALALVVALQASAVGAPLVHVHPDDHATAHHAGHALHAHWAGHHQPLRPAPGHPIIDHNDDDRAVYVKVFIAVAPASLWMPLAAGAVFQLAPPAGGLAFRRIDVVRSHDPPVSPTRSPRAPPLFLS